MTGDLLKSKKKAEKHREPLYSLSFSVTKTERDAISLFAQESGLSRSAYIKACALKKYPTSIPQPEIFTLLEVLGQLSEPDSETAAGAVIIGIRHLIPVKELERILMAVLSARGKDISCASSLIKNNTIITGTGTNTYVDAEKTIDILSACIIPNERRS